MAIPIAKYNGVNLPVNFKYKYIPIKRISIEETLTSVDIQTFDYVDDDLTIEWSVRWADYTIRDLFLTAYENGDINTFIDYEGNSKNVLIIEYNEEKSKGFYHLSGKFQNIT